MTGNDLANMYEFSYLAINRNLNELTHEDTVFIPEPSGNCINWVLGHIVSARGMMLLLTGADRPIFSHEEGAPYQRGSAAMKAGDPGMDLAHLKSALEDSQKKIVPALRALSEEALAAPVPEKYKRPPLMGTVGEALATLHYHEGYHNGQIGLLRRLAGKEGAIR
jgi:uncharacterized damage-inducible protein DinB